MGRIYRGTTQITCLWHVSRPG